MPKRMLTKILLNIVHVFVVTPLALEAETKDH